MYKEDVAAINYFVNNKGIKGFKSVFYFVLGSIRTRFYHIDEITNEINNYGLSSKHVWGNKIKAYNDFESLYTYLYNSVYSDSALPILIRNIMQINGIGLAKSNFLLQLLGKETACLDVHNLIQLGLPQDYFKNKNKLEEYLTLVSKDTSENWWNNWCQAIATRYPTRFKNADEVSKLHVKAIVNA